MQKLVWVVTVLLFAGCDQGLSNIGDNAFSDAKDLTEDVTVNCAESDQSFFNRAVWPILSITCEGCHAQGNADTSGNGPDLVVPTNAADAFGVVQNYITSHSHRLSNKPTMNGVGHSGGRVLDIDSQEASNLAQMIVRVNQPVGSCIDTGGEVAREPGFDDVSNISASRTARKAAILLQGRMPTSAELTLAQTDDAGLRSVLTDYMQGDIFEQWLMNSANDQLLTRKYFTGQTDGQEALSADTYNYNGLHDRTQAAFDTSDAARVACANTGGSPAADATEPECQTAYVAQRDAGFIYQETQRALADEPLQLIRHIVTNDLPYSDVLTADYMMMNPFTYDVLDGQTWTASHDSMDPTDWRPGHIRQYQFAWNNPIAADAYLPSAGILTSPVFLARYPSTDTNRNRARARWTYYYFMGTDIERLAVRAMDPEELKNVTNPGAQDTSCYGCHIIMDPVAGAFQSWGNAGQYLVRNGNDSLPQSYVDTADYQTGDQWYRGQIKAGFGGADMPMVGDYGRNTSHDDGLQWLAEQMVADNRFATGTTKFWFKGLFGRVALVPPTASSDADYAAKLQAYQDEQSLINDWAEAFRASNLNLKSLLIDMMVSPMYRGESFTSDDANRKLALADMGVGRLLTPEQLDRKATATTGFNWKLDWQEQNQLLEDYYMFYGGIDSDGITTRTEALNSLMYSVTERMANEVACEIVGQEFWPGMSRKLFTAVEFTTDPTSVEGESAIRNVIANLQWRLWGVVDDVEQEALWGLYKALYDQRISWKNNNAEYVSDYLSYAVEYDGNRTDEAQDENCRFVDYDDSDGVDINVNWTGVNWSGTADQIRENLGSNYNPEQTLRPWVGVLTMMLTDTQFLTE